MANISAMGTGSGIDIKQLVESILESEGKAKTQKMNKDEAAALEKITAYGNFRNSLTDFKSILDNLQDPTLFSNRICVSDNPAYVTGTVDTPSAAPGNYQIEVINLAQAQKITSIDFGSADTVVGTGILTFTFGSTSYSVNIDGSHQTLSGIQDQINAVVGSVGVSASIITVDSGTRLVLTSKETGLQNAFTVSATDDDGNNTDKIGLSQLISTYSTPVTPALNSLVNIDGLPVTSSSNSLENAISGITINLLQKNPGTKYNLTVNTDTSAANNMIQTFVNGYNAVITTISSLSSYKNNGAGATTGVLIGDSTLRSVETLLRREINTAFAVSSPLDFTLFSQIGITTNYQTGQLEINQSILNKSISSNFNSIKNIFTNETDGMAYKLDKVIQNFTNSSGLIFNRIEGLNEGLKDIKKQRIDLEMRLQSIEKRYLAQFSAMDSLLAGFKNTSEYLKREFENLPPPFRRSTR